MCSDSGKPTWPVVLLPSTVTLSSYVNAKACCGLITAQEVPVSSRDKGKP